jgi:prevent-host-death family protein
VSHEVVVGVADAHDRLSELIDQALAGADVVITRRSAPVVRLAPVVPVRPAGNGPEIAATAIRLLDQHRSGRTVAQIDAELRAERDSWD